jgi:hypothetical protein
MDVHDTLAAVKSPPLTEKQRNVQALRKPQFPYTPGNFSLTFPSCVTSFSSTLYFAPWAISSALNPSVLLPLQT